MKRPLRTSFGAITPLALSLFTPLALSLFTPLALSLFCATGAGAQDLTSFAILGASTVTSTGNSVINGNVGLYPGTSITGFPPGIVNPPYTIHQTDAVAQLAQAQNTTLYNSLGILPSTSDLTGQDLGTVGTLSPGVYNFDSSAQLTGTLTLDGGGNPNAIFVFQIGSTLTTAGASAIVLTNGASAANVFFLVGSSATLGTTTAFKGEILALADISLLNAASINCGAAWSQTGAVTLINNAISVCPIAAARFGTGEAGSGGEFAATLAMNSFLSQLFDSPFSEGRGLGPGDENAPGPGTVRVLGYGPEDSPSAARSIFESFIGKAGGTVPDPRRWYVWAAAYGSQNTTAGDALAGTHGRTARAYGFTTGFDHRVSPNTSVGIAVSAGRTDFRLSDDLGTGHSDMLELALRGRSDFNNSYVAGAIAYGFHAASTARDVTFTGERLTGSYFGHDVAARLEIGYRFAWFSPYAALGSQAFFTPAYSESPSSSALAIGYDAHTATTLRTELGVRVNQSVPLSSDRTLALRGRVAWAHDFWSDPNATAHFLATPTLSFPTLGAVPPTDSLLVSAGAEIRLRSGVALAGVFDGEFARGSQTYVGTVRLSYSW
jgi:hypothetical protein